MEPPSTSGIRRHDIDWLRVILFGLLIPFHVAIGVYWTTYGERVNPNIDDDSSSNEVTREEAVESDIYTPESVDLTSLILHWMHQWRLAALFMISGMGTAFAFKRRTWKTFLSERCQRLLLPMFFGMWTVGFIGGLILGVIDSGEEPLDLIGALFWHVVFTSLLVWIPVLGKLLALGHLWFLSNLFLYSLICVPLFHVVRNDPEGGLVRFIRSLFTVMGGMGILFILPLGLVAVELVFKPWFPGFLGAGYEWLWFLIFFIFGYSCIIAKEEYYGFLNQKRIHITALTVIMTIAFIWLRLAQHDTRIPYVDGGWLEAGVYHDQMTIIACFVHSFHAWFWCLTIFSWGAHLLNHPSDRLAYLNQGVYPFYIVHMPLTFAGLSIAKWFGLTNMPAVIFATVFVILCCGGFFEIVKRTKPTRVLFGIKSVVLEKTDSPDQVMAQQAPVVHIDSTSSSEQASEVD